MANLFGTPEVNTQPLDGEKGRKERGAFFTDDRLALEIARVVERRLLPNCDEGAPEPRVFEPGCGGGAFLRAAARTWPREQLLGVDLLPACDGPGVVEQRSLFDVRGPFDLCLGNPDFGIAAEVVRHCMGILAPGGFVAFLLRLSFLESADRVQLYRDFPLRLFQPIAQRQSFTGEGQTDKVGLGLFVWKQGHAGPGEILSPLVWR